MYQTRYFIALAKTSRASSNIRILSASVSPIQRLLKSSPRSIVPFGNSIESLFFHLISKTSLSYRTTPPDVVYSHGLLHTSHDNKKLTIGSIVCFVRPHWRPEHWCTQADTELTEDALDSLVREQTPRDSSLAAALDPHPCGPHPENLGRAATVYSSGWSLV